MTQSNLHNIQSICILRLSAIGDVCHAVASVQALQRALPQAQITWVIGKIEAALLEGMPGVRFVIFDKKQGVKAYLDLRKQLKGERFDVLLHMQLAFRANLAAWCIPAKRKVGFDHARSKELHGLFINERIAPQHEPHVLEGFAAFVQHLGIPFLSTPQEQPTWEMPLTDADQAWATQVIQEIKQQGYNRIFLLCPAASKAERNWLPERYAKVADYVHSKGFFPIICGGPTEHERILSQAIRTYTKKETLDLVGQTSLKQLLAFIQQADVVLAPDTGPAHMAVTVSTPVIGLYGHSNPRRTGPYLYLDYVVEAYEEAIELQTGKKLANIPFGTRAKGEHVMSNIQVEEVIEIFNELLDTYDEDL